ncbi:MAG TPA: hypothetical protein DCL44_09565 [Elusimicrobia bacterium]|nr:hypothetical protein [Elusimicrobiota bacterium]
MNSNSTDILHRLTASSLEKCLLRLSRVSAGTWRVLNIKISEGTLEDAVKQHDFTNHAAAVYFGLKTGSTLTAIMLLNPADIECISKCFTGHSFPRGPHTTPAEEVMLQELGNIVLNSLVSSLLNTLKKHSIPAVPQYIEGDAAHITGGLGTVADLKQKFRMIKATLVIQFDKCETNSEVFIMIPDEMALELERAATGWESFLL